MSVKRPPRSRKQEKRIGGRRPAAKRSESDRPERTVNLRIPAGMLAQVDRVVMRRRLPTPRHRWLLEAIDEKLEREMDV